MLQEEKILIDNCEVQRIILEHLPRIHTTNVIEIEPCQESLEAFRTLIKTQQINSYEGITLNKKRYNFFEERFPELNITHIEKGHSHREYLSNYLIKENDYDIVIINKSLITGEQLRDYLILIKEKKIDAATYSSNKFNQGLEIFQHYKEQIPFW